MVAGGPIESVCSFLALIRRILHWFAVAVAIAVAVADAVSRWVAGGLRLASVIAVAALGELGMEAWQTFQWVME